MDFSSIQKRAEQSWLSLQESQSPVIYVGTATCGCSAGAKETIQAVQKILKEKKITAQIVEVGCLGLCYAEPLVYIQKPNQPGIIYGNITEKEVPELVEHEFIQKTPWKEFALGSLGDKTVSDIPKFYDIPVMKHQVRRISRRCGFIDPNNIQRYIATQGYRGLVKALLLKSDAVIEEMKASGLRGRGGAGFPTWRKWQFCIDAK